MPRHPRRRLPLSAEEAAAGRTPFEQIELERFAKKLQAARTKKGWSQSDLARAVWGSHTNQRTGKVGAKNRDRISVYEAGKSFPDPHNLVKIADVLGVSPEALAPDITAATMERENPEVAIVAHGDKVHLKVNKVISFDLASRVMALLNGG
jgi:transcriptional regulator with XRE-family HTH domain